MSALPGCTCTSRTLLRTARRAQFASKRFESTFQWRRAVPEGQLAAYDEALKVIEQDRQEKRVQVAALRKDGQSEVQAKIEELEALAEINDPETRALFEHGQGTVLRFQLRRELKLLRQRIIPSLSSESSTNRDGAKTGIWPLS
jgi:hypothetical protein